MYSEGNLQNTCFRLGPPAGSPRDQFKKNVTDPEQEIDKKIGHKIYQNIRILIAYSGPVTFFKLVSRRTGGWA